MKQVKESAEYTVFLRKDKRYAVRGANRQWIHGDEKVAILQKEKLQKAPEPKAEKASPEEAEGTDA